MIPNPTVLIPDTVNIWSAFASMIATLSPFAYVPGVFDATVTPVIVSVSYTHLTLPTTPYV